ncbi:MAG TPA: hypothetical protein VF174_00445 [Micromonosporaceae bacterium]
MTVTAAEETKTRSDSHGAGWRHLLPHFLEMVAAMVVGMVVLGVAVRITLFLIGQSHRLDPLEARVVLMAVDMAIGMTVWMRYRRHRWAGILEMNAAMIASFLILLLPYWAGVLPERAVMAVGHVVMLPVMALVMLRRRAEYGAV